MSSQFTSVTQALVTDAMCPMLKAAPCACAVSSTHDSVWLNSEVVRAILMLAHVQLSKLQFHMQFGSNHDALDATKQRL